MTKRLMFIEEVVEALKGANLFQVAVGTNIHPNALTRYKSGKVKPNYDNLLKLSNYFGGSHEDDTV
jgi:transcriptional regulator with XRE-family HTH domain